MVTLQDPVPEQAPPQPLKLEPAAGVWARVTTVPALKFALQVAPQLMPAGRLVIVPLAAGEVLTESAKEGTKVAVTVVAAFTVTLQGLVPAQALPLQPAKAEPGAASAVNNTLVPEL